MPFALQMSATGEIFTVLGATNRISPYKMSAAGENFPVSRGCKEDFTFKMSAAGEIFLVLVGCKGFYLPKFAVSRHFQTLILQPGRKFPPCFRSEHNKGGNFLQGGEFSPGNQLIGKSFV